MASNDLNRIKQNVGKMVSAGAPEDEIDAYIVSEGATVDQIRTHSIPYVPSPGAAPTPSPGEVARSVGKGAIEALPFIGAMGLTVAAGPEAGIPALILAAMAGGAGGEAWRQVAHGGEDTVTEAIKGIANEGMSQAGYEAVGRIPLKVAGKAYRAVVPAKPVFPEAAKVEALAKPYMKEVKQVAPISNVLGVKRQFLTPAQATQRKGLDVLENISEKAIFAQRLTEHQELQKQIGKRVVNDWLDTVAPRMEPEDIGELFIETVKGNREAFMSAMSGKYKALDEMTKTATVDIAALKKFAQSKLDENAIFKGIGSSDAGDTLVKNVSRLPDTITFSQAHQLRSRLIKEAERVGATSRKDPAIGLAKKFTGMTDNAMMTSSRNLSGQAKLYFRRLSREYRTGIEPFNHQVVRRLAQYDQAPEKIGRMLFQPGNVTAVKKAREALGAKEWHKFQRVLGEKIYNDSKRVATEGAESFVDYRKFDKMLNRYKDTIRETMGAKGVADLEDISNLLKLSQRRQGAGTGGMFIQLTQARSTVQVAQGAAAGFAVKSGDIITPTVILLGPVSFGRLTTNPIGMRLLKTGLRLPKGSPMAATLAVRIKAFLDEQEANEQKLAPKGPTPLERIDALYRKAANTPLLNPGAQQ